MEKDYSKYENMPQRSGMGRGDGRREHIGNRINSFKQKRPQSQTPVQNNISKAKIEEFETKQQGVNDELNKLWAKYRASFSVEDETALREFAEKNNLRLSIYPEAAKDERSEIARIAFNGTVERPNGGYSQAYKDIVDNPLKYATVQRSKDEYNLDDSSLWQVMKQFPEFADIKNRITSGLAKAGVPPEMLPQMNMNDFRHLLFNHCSAGQSTSFAKIFPQTDENGNIIRDFRTQKPLTTSAKQRNTIRFITEHPEFAETMMKLPGARKDYVDELVNQMKKGNTDMTPFLAKHPEWKDQTAINIHHIINIKDCRLLESQGRPLSDINDYDNMCVMGCGTLEEIVQKKCGKTSKYDKLPGAHGAMHNNDTTFRNNAAYRPKWGQYTPPGEKDVIARMEPAPGVCCMLAFGDEYTIVDENRKQRIQERQEQQQKKTPELSGLNKVISEQSK